MEQFYLTLETEPDSRELTEFWLSNWAVKTEKSEDHTKYWFNASLNPLHMPLPCDFSVSLYEKSFSNIGTVISVDPTQRNGVSEEYRKGILRELSARQIPKPSSLEFVLEFVK